VNDWILPHAVSDAREEAQQERDTAAVSALLDTFSDYGSDRFREGIFPDDALEEYVKLLFAEAEQMLLGYVGDLATTTIPMLHEYMVEYTGEESPWVRFSSQVYAAAEILEQSPEAEMILQAEERKRDAARPVTTIWISRHGIYDIGTKTVSPA